MLINGNIIILYLEYLNSIIRCLFDRLGIHEYDYAVIMGVLHTCLIE